MWQESTRTLQSMAALQALAEVGRPGHQRAGEATHRDERLLLPGQGQAPLGEIRLARRGEARKQASVSHASRDPVN